MSKRSAHYNNPSLESPTKRGRADDPSVNATEIECFLAVLRNSFPLERFAQRLPVILMRHQVYSLSKNRTLADHQLDVLQTSGILKFFKLGGEEEAQVVIFTNDFVSHVKQHHGQNCALLLTIERFLSTVVPTCKDLGISKSQLIQQLSFTEENITSFINAGLLTVRGAGQYWFSFPGAGEFMKAYLKGRKAVLSAIKKSKYQQMLKSDLEQRAMKKAVPLGISYHIHDIIGADLVTCMETSSGLMLKYTSPTNHSHT